MSPPSVFPAVAVLINGPRYREIVLPHYVYSGVLQVSCFSLPVTPWEPGEEGIGHQVLTVLFVVT